MAGIIDTSVYQNTRKFCPTLQHHYVEIMSCMTSSKMPFTDKDGHLTKAFQTSTTAVD